jgi:energy-coupling factor transport system ATP-binding protein
MLIFEHVSFNYGYGAPLRRRARGAGQGRAGRPRWGERAKRGGRADRGENLERADRLNRAESAEHAGRPGCAEHAERLGRAKSAGHADRPNRPGRAENHAGGAVHGREPASPPPERILGATISDVSFRLGEGEFAALMGENGAGKSTLCRLCNGLLLPDSGSVTACGLDTRGARTSAIAANVGFLFQNPDRQLCQNTVRDEIMFGLGLAMPNSAESERAQRCDETLGLFGLDGARDPFGLSRGERQLAALASVLACRPRLLVLDEPTTGLDYRECMGIMSAVKRLQRAGASILMITHDMEVALDFAERALVLSRGRLIFDGRMKDVMRDAGVLGEASLLPAQIPSLALELGESFDGVSTVEEMADTAERLARRNGWRG